MLVVDPELVLVVEPLDVELIPDDVDVEVDVDDLPLLLAPELLVVVWL